MSLPYPEIVQSKPTEFVVGELEKRFWIHRSLVGHQSEVLKELINGQPREITLPKVSEGTFARFAEYLYTGSYTAAGFILVEDAEATLSSECGLHTPVESTVAADSAPTPEPEECLPTVDSAPPPEPAECYSKTGWTNFGWNQPAAEPVKADDEACPASVPDELSSWPSKTKRKTKKSLSKRAKYEPECIEAVPPPHSPPPPQTEPTQPRYSKDELWAVFKGRAYVDQEPRRPTPTLRPNENSAEIYTPVFLSHAEMFAFASTYNIQNLRHLAIRNLHDTLVSFTLYPDRVSDISALLEFAYKFGEIGDTVAQPLRDMAADYAVCHFEEMFKDPLFGRLLAGGGPITLDLMAKVMQRLH